MERHDVSSRRAGTFNGPRQPSNLMRRSATTIAPVCASSIRSADTVNIGVIAGGFCPLIRFHCRSRRREWLHFARMLSQ